MARHRKPPADAKLLQQFEQLARLLSEHSARGAAEGKLKECRCDLCRHASVRIAKIRRRLGT